MRQSERHELTHRFRRFATHEARGSSPLYERLSEVLADSPVVLELYDVVDFRQRRPNLLLAAMHAMLLAGTQHELAGYYPSVGGSKLLDDALISTAVDFIRSHRAQLRSWMADRATQTNEVRRSALVLAALNQIRWRGPAVLVDVGAAAGLNLLVDRYGYRYGDQEINTASPVRIDCTPAGHHEPPPLSLVPVAHRLGIDLNPLRLTDADNALWLRACVWPEHHHRRQLLDAAISLARQDPPSVVPGDAVETLGEAVARFPAEQHVVVFHCATLAYMPLEQREVFTAQLEALAQRRVLSWIVIEGPFIPPYDRLDEDHPTPPAIDSAYLTVGLTEWINRQRDDRLLARADPHGAWIQWLEVPTTTRRSTTPP